MKKEPFIINLTEENLPNIATEEENEEFNFQYDKSNVWNQEEFEKNTLLGDISDKLDKIIQLLKQNGKG